MIAGCRASASASAEARGTAYEIDAVAGCRAILPRRTLGRAPGGAPGLVRHGCDKWGGGDIAFGRRAQNRLPRAGTAPSLGRLKK